MLMADDRIVYGIHCVWWDGIEKVGHTPPNRDGISIPCCPHCGSVLYELPSPKEWWDGVDKYEADGHPGYRDFISWLKGKCYPGRNAAKAAYEASGKRKVTL
jgi:hypothetical protein